MTTKRSVLSHAVLSHAVLSHAVLSHAVLSHAVLTACHSSAADVTLLLAWSWPGQDQSLHLTDNSISPSSELADD